MTASANVLVLNIDYSPLEVISWSDAMEKILNGKMELVADYAGRFVRSAYQTWPFPAVVRLTKKFAHRKVRLSRLNVLARDSFTCQYCGLAPRKKSGMPAVADLTIDHIIPRAQSKEGFVTMSWAGKKKVARTTSWENLVCACYQCNSAKADRTPGQANMPLAKLPRPPNTVDVARMAITAHRIPDEWKAFLPEASPWREYWSVELDPS